ncbi:MAG TPA: DUF899 domain-containing protein [Iamia sp.]|nr:DUF899 domain-containing protein [Iamia sp.]
MALPEIVSPEEWRVARIALLEEEKALTRARDELSTHRRQLPMVEVEADYRFTGPDGVEATLLDLFDGRRQLIVSHFMFEPEWTDGCPSCTAGAEEVADGLRDHLARRDTRLVYVSRAPIEKIEAYKAKKGWTFPWYSSFGSLFNYDFHVTIDEAVRPGEYNYRSQDDWAERDPAWAGWAGEQPGTSCFLRVGDDVFHTYSSFGRGSEWTGGSYAYLDLTALGRQEDWEEPAGRSDSVRPNNPDFAR